MIYTRPEITITKYDKIIVAGTRDLEVSSTMVRSFMVFFRIRPKTILTGGSGCVDVAGEGLATQYKDKIGYKEFVAKWGAYGKSAGPRRNAEMAKEGDALLVIWDGKSRGSKNMKENMEKLGKPIYEVILKGKDNA